MTARTMHKLAETVSDFHNRSLVNMCNENSLFVHVWRWVVVVVVLLQLLPVSIFLVLRSVGYSVCERKIRHGTRGRSNAAPWSASWEVFIVGYPRSWESGLFIGHSLLSLFPFPPSTSPSLSILLYHTQRPLSFSPFFSPLPLTLSCLPPRVPLPLPPPLSSALSFHLSSLPLPRRPGFVHDTDFLRYYAGIQGVLSNDPYPILAFFQKRSSSSSLLSFFFLFLLRARARVCLLNIAIPQIPCFFSRLSLYVLSCVSLSALLFLSLPPRLFLAFLVFFFVRWITK